MSSSCTSFINEEFNSDEKKTAKHTRNTLAFFFCSVTNCTWLSHSLSLSLSFCHTHAHTVDAFVYNSLFQWHAIASHILFDFAKCSHHYCLVWFNFSFALNCVCSSIWVEEKRFIHTNFWNILDWDFFSEHKIRPHTMNSQNWKPSFSNYIHQTECHSKCDEMCLLLYRTYSIKKKKKFNEISLDDSLKRFFLFLSQLIRPPLNVPLFTTITFNLYWCYSIDFTQIAHCLVCLFFLTI